MMEKARHQQASIRTTFVTPEFQQSNEINDFSLCLVRRVIFWTRAQRISAVAGFIFTHIIKSNLYVTHI